MSPSNPHGRPGDSRDPRDPRDPRNGRGGRDQYRGRDPRAPRDPRGGHGDGYQGRDSRPPRDPRYGDPGAGYGDPRGGSHGDRPARPGDGYGDRGRYDGPAGSGQRDPRGAGSYGDRPARPGGDPSGGYGAGQQYPDQWDPRGGASYGDRPARPGGDPRGGGSHGDRPARPGDPRAGHGGAPGPASRDPWEGGHGDPAADTRAPRPGRPQNPHPPGGRPTQPAPPRRDDRTRHRAGSARSPRSHWILMAFMMFALVSMLLLGGILNHQITAEGSGGPHTPLGDSGVPAAVSAGGPVIDARGGAERSLSVLPGKIALTFDDGPDPTWTPQVLAVLGKYHVPGTFFVIGAHVAEHPDLVRDEVKSGSEVGVHTFTHTDLAQAPDWRRSLEFSQTQSVIAGATGLSTPLLRPPYSSMPDAVDRLDWSAIQKAGHDGYLVVLTDRDSEDWQRGGVPKILANAIPPAPAPPAKGQKAQPEPGFILMMHDAGGDRSQTVAALDQLIPQLQARGFTFTTVSGAIGAASPLTPVGSSAAWKGKGLIFAVQASDFVVRWLGWAMLAAGVLAGLRILVLLFAAHRHARKQPVDWGPPMRAPVSVIVPAYNEEAGIRATVESLSLSRHPIEIIVVDDGSTDRTSEIVQDMIDTRGRGQHPLRLIQQVNGGKPSALNAGAARARTDILVMMDGDTVFEPDTIGYLVQPFADPSVGAVSGNAKVGNRTGILGRWQHIEYVVGFNLERRMYDLAGCMPTVPGAVGAFRRDALARVGGVSHDTLAEDTDVTMAVIRDGWRVVYEERAVAWTEVPTSIRQFWRQRYRWCYGTLQAMWKHRRSVLRGGAEGRLGRRGLPYMFLFQVVMPLLAPIVDVLAVYGLVFNDTARVGAIWLAFLASQMVMALYAFRLDKERPTALWTLPLQQVVYRQLMYLVVIHSLVTAVVGTRLRWQRMQRHGSLEIPAQAASR